MKQIFAISSAGVRTVLPSYFARLQGYTVLGADWQPVNPRTDPVVVFKKWDRYWLEDPDLSHLLKVATDFEAATYSTDRRTIETPSQMIIDGANVETGDRIEISATLATALNIAPGTWLAESDRKITLEKAPTYTMTDVWASINTPWQYRTDPDTGELVGLAVHVPTITATKNKNSGALIKSPGNLIDGNLYSMVDSVNVSWQGLRYDFESFKLRRMALRTRSEKVAYEGSFKASRFKVVLPGVDENISDLFYNLNTRVKAANNVGSATMVTFALATTEIWYTNEMDLDVGVISYDKDGGSRCFTGFHLCTDAPCQLKIKGIAPPSGSEIEIPDSVADDWAPAISPGRYLLRENSETAQWRLSKI
jgi:hypothetical protein